MEDTRALQQETQKQQSRQGGAVRQAPEPTRAGDGQAQPGQRDLGRQMHQQERIPRCAERLEAGRAEG